MKHMMKALVLGGALAILAPFAHATSIIASINVGGTDSFDPTAKTISFPAGQQLTTGGSSLNGTPITFATLVQFAPGPFTYDPSINLALPGYNLASINSLGLKFFLLTETPTYVADNGQNAMTLDLKGTGYFTLAGYDNTNVTFDLTSQRSLLNNVTTTSFSASTGTLAPTPEPSSLILLGTGVLGAAGMLRRRFAGKSNA